MTTVDIEERPTRGFRPGAVLGGVVLLALGAGLLLDRSGSVQLHHVTAPLVLIVLGALMTVERSAFIYSVPVKDETGKLRFQTRQRGGFGPGAWLIAIGAWMLVSQNHLWGFTPENSWPLFLVFVGLKMVVRGWWR